MRKYRLITISLLKNVHGQHEQLKINNFTDDEMMRRVVEFDTRCETGAADRNRIPKPL